MFDKFSLNVRKIFKRCENEMLMLNHPYVGTEHLMLALLKEKDIQELCQNYNLNYHNFYQELVNIMGNDRKNDDIILYTPLLKRVINSAIEDSINNNEEVNAKYLLKAIIDEGEGIAIRIMFSLNVDIDELYNKLDNSNNKGKKKLEIYNIGKRLKDNIDLDDLVIGRDKEIELILETLIRKNKNNPLLIGEAGVGKTAIVEEIQRRIMKKMVPDYLKNKEIVLLELGSLVAGTKYRGEFEEKLTKIIKELESNPNIIVFIDEIHAIVNAGGAEGAINASDILKPYLARGKIKLIGATTTKEYNNTILKDKALMRRFEIIKVLEPDEKETLNILKKVKKNYEKHYNLKISLDNLNDIVTLSNRYILDRQNPDKSLDILDSVCAMVRVKQTSFHTFYEVKEKIAKLEQKKKEFIKQNNYEEATKIYTEINNYKQKENNIDKVIKINHLDILELLSKKCNLPLLIDKKKLLKNIENNLKLNILGQNQAIKQIISNLENYYNLNLEKPLCLLETGSTGVGKTECVKIIAKSLNIPLIRLDMSEYNLDISINKLIGSSAGYIGYNDDAILNKVRMNPFSIILVDELEKAHSSVLNLFLQIMDEGFVTNSQGEKLDFKNTLIFMTSNVKGNKKIGFLENNNDYSDYFSKEFLARFDDIINFNDISYEVAKEYLKRNNINDDSIINKINYQKYGLREVKRYLNRNHVYQKN